MLSLHRRSLLSGDTHTGPEWLDMGGGGVFAMLQKIGSVLFFREEIHV